MPAEKHSVPSPDKSTEDVRNKRLKIESLPASSDKENVAGYLEKLYMRNFMCHSSLEISFNKRINFIIGKNGSGKSAIFAAVVIALGCKASTTNRASSIRELIKRDSSSASIHVTLCNEGLNAYKQEVYGSKITVVRTIFRSSGQSSYKFKSEKGEVISTKREELDKIVIALNIQVDNPISVLNQETAKTFLSSTDPKMKYSFFLKATKLEDVDQIYVKSLNCETGAEHRMKLRKECMKLQEKEIEDLEKKVKALEKLDEIKNRSVILEREYYWALVRDEEIKLLELERDVEKERKNGKALEIHLRKYKEEFEKKNNSVGEVESLLEENNEKMKLRRQGLQEAKNVSQAANTMYKNHLQKYKQLRKENKACELEIQGVLEEIEKHKSGEDILKEKKRLIEAIEALKGDERITAATQKTTEEEYEKLRYQYDILHEQGNALQKEKCDIEKSIGKIMDKLKTSQANDNNLSVYGNWMPRLVQRIEECNRNGMFVRKPLGPLGAMLSVKDPEWTRAIQSELYGILRMFACHCSKDSKTLQSLFKEVINGDRNPGILVSKFTDQLYDIRNTCVKVPGYKNLFDALQFTDINVANILIDNKSIETILLIPTNQEAITMMSRNVPKNCRRSITKTADLYFPYPDYRTYAPSQQKHWPLLKVSQRELIRELEEGLKANQDTLNEKKLEMRELTNNINKNDDKLKSGMKRIKELRYHKSTITERLKKHETDLEKLPDPQHYVMLNSELENLKEKVNSLMEKLEEADQESDSLKNKCDQADEDVKRIQAEVKEIDETIQNLQVEFGNQKETVRRAESKVTDAEGLLSEHTIKVNKMIELLKEKEKQTEKAVEAACVVCPKRILSKRAANDINRDITDIQTYQRTVEKENGVMAGVSDILKEKKRNYQENVDHLRNIRSGFQVLSQSLEERKNLYLTIKKLMELKVSYVFKPLLFNRGYKGDMHFDHAAKTLEVSVSPRNEAQKLSTKSLSGGERSYSTVSFILALWNCVEPPFYFMDEFDVFMDKVNRRIVMEMLLSQALENKKHQFFFFTPCDTSIVRATKDITIHKLDDPVRATGSSRIS